MMYDIPLIHFLYMLLPLSWVVFYYGKWVGNGREMIHALVRMLVQLIAIGYVLVLIFQYERAWLGALILMFMLIVSTFITLRNTIYKSCQHYFIILIATTLSALFHLFLIVYVILDIHKIYEPRFLIPLAGMVFSTIMNVLSLAIERFEADYQTHKHLANARQHAFKAAMIPQINALFAVGLVSLPGMMTGQILSGIDPLIAVRYQILIMLLGISGGGGSVVLYFLIMDKWRRQK